MIFLVNFTYENYMTYIYYINLVVVIIKQHKVTFCSCKFSQKNNIEPHKNFTGSYEKSLEVIDEFQDTVSKGRKVKIL